MSGLSLLGRALDPEARAALAAEANARRASWKVPAGEAAAPLLAAPPVRSPRIEIVDSLPPPDEEEHVLQALDLSEVWPYVNDQMLYGKHLGLRGGFAKLKEAGDRRALELGRIVDEAKGSGWIRARAVYRFFGAESEGDDLHLLSAGRRVATFRLPRQRAGDRECIADYARPAAAGGGDSVALFVTTAGEGVRERAESLKREGRFLLCHALQALALETAEAAAEWLHQKIRERWGLPDAAGTTMLDRFQARYRGKRYSFGYPACPDLSAQALLFDLLKPERIGVSLTEGFMMDPEASVSALVVHHPQARYFSVQ
jgi:5-methyltetrahydrofolate--homocysteine methyltransferase